MIVLSIESSCDETAAAIMDGDTLRSSVISSQMTSHEKYGGVVPELAGRHHLESINNVVAAACEQAGVSLRDVDLFAGCRGPGLAAALLVGATAAKTYAFALDKPFIGVHHHEAHILSVLLEQEDVAFPFVSLLVSGGHTMVVIVDEPGSYRVLGGTIDDAAGEAYDKVARLLGLGYPGGPKIDVLAAQGNANAYQLPRPMKNDPYNFSFSGLKTAVKRLMQTEPDAPHEDVCASFQAAVVDSLMMKCETAIQSLNNEDKPARAFSIGGGVAANSYLRDRATELAEQYGLEIYIPDRSMCTDNAAMIAVAGAIRFERDGADPLDVGVDPGWKLSDLS
jgi:N6-L-threonylcarbamoyladenine synthase